MAFYQEKYPNLSAIYEHIATSSPFQKKAVAKFWNTMDEAYFVFAESFVERLLRAVGREQGYRYLAEAYLAYTKQIRIEEMYFAQNKAYRHDNYDLVYEAVYAKDDYMRDYVAGLGMTQIFWPNHYAIVQFFRETFLPRVAQAKAGAEIGVGHGLFHSELLRVASGLRTVMLDVSAVSLATTKGMIEALGLDADRAEATLCDVRKGVPLADGSLDVLLLGELIEHIDDGASLMHTLAAKMKKDGLCFFTTAANAPAEDHILLFRTVGEIREFVRECGWTPQEECIGTVGGMDLEKAEAEGHNINYAAILKAC